MGLLSILFSRRDREPPSLGFAVDPGDDFADMIAEALRDELAVLILVARADGRFVKAEQNMMLKYASERAREMAVDLNDEAQVVLLNWIKTQDPSEPEARIAIRNLARRPDALESIWEVSELIAEADGKVREQEVTALREVRAAIELIVAEEAQKGGY